MDPAPGSLLALRRGAFCFGLLAALGSGCARPPAPGLAERQANVEARIVSAGLSDDSRVGAARSELEAALARENDRVLIDSVELRAAAVTKEDDTRMDGLVRLPIGNILEFSAVQDARRADSRAALAELSGAILASRIERCLPSLEYQVDEERAKVLSEYLKQYRALLDWNEQLRRAGLVDEIQWSRFRLASHVKLAKTTASRSLKLIETYGPNQMVNVLPSVEPGLGPLDADEEALRARLSEHQPALEVLQARKLRYEAMARGASMARLPSIRFVDFGFEPVVSPGDEREYTARIAFDVPFGRESAARTRRYRALARAEVNDQRRVLDELVRASLVAIDEINRFRAREKYWNSLTALADASEKVAARWWEDRRSGPQDISRLLDTVLSARNAVLGARERAGAASCALLAASGLAPAKWDDRRQ
jgi:hypothetical protein